MKILTYVLFIITMASCTTIKGIYDNIPTLNERLDACEARGISRDVCYKVEMDKQRDIRNRTSN